jgi:outer membrane lipoprotein-sorting protein
MMRFLDLVCRNESALGSRWQWPGVVIAASGAQMELTRSSAGQDRGGMLASMQGVSMTAHFSRRALLALSAAAMALPAVAAPASALSPDDKALVDKAVAYLESLTSAKGRFTQFDARGRRSEGDLYIKRPGKARFAYDPPSSLLLVSDGGTVNVWDSKLKTFESYPLGMTPLGLFLAKQIRLDKGVVVTGVRRYADAFAITARDRKKEAEGEITLTFNADPVSLREWTVRDAQNQSTRVVISNLAPAGGLDPKLFVLRDPRPGPGTARR